MNLHELIPGAIALLAVQGVLALAYLFLHKSVFAWVNKEIKAINDFTHSWANELINFKNELLQVISKSEARIASLEAKVEAHSKEIESVYAELKRSIMKLEAKLTPAVVEPAIKQLRGDEGTVTNNI